MNRLSTALAMKSDMQTMPSLLTYDDYCLIPDDGLQYEVVYGALHMSPSPRYLHQKIMLRLSSLLDQFARETGAGEVIIAPFDVVLSEHNVVQPDLLFISKERRSILTDKNVQGPPDFVVEVLSEGNRKYDEEVKRKLYEQFGVREYWIVDPELESIKVYHLEGDRYRLRGIFWKKQRDMLSSKLLEASSFPLTDIF